MQKKYKSVFFIHAFMNVHKLSNITVHYMMIEQ